MGTNKHGSKHPFSPPTEDDIKGAWASVRSLQVEGHDRAATAVARCVYFVEQVRELLGVYRPDPQPWSFPQRVPMIQAEMEAREQTQREE